MLGGQIVDRVMASLGDIDTTLRSIAGHVQTHAFWKNRICKSITGAAGQGFLIKVMGIDTAGVTFKAEETSGDNQFVEGETYFISFNDKHPITLRTLRKDEKAD